MRTHTPIIAYIGLGSNVGPRCANIERALSRMKSAQVHVSRVSQLLENPAEGMGDDVPQFLNGVAEVETILGAHALLKLLLGIEQSLGRTRAEKWQPRTIDLDLLLYGDQIISSDELIVPHPLMHERRFVLQPLAELNHGLIHPTLQMTVGGLLQACEQQSRDTRSSARLSPLDESLSNHR